VTITTPETEPLGGVESHPGEVGPHLREVESLLAEARARTLALVEPGSEPDLDRVYTPLMSPPVWDLGHIAAFEDLWVCREAGLDPLRPAAELETAGLALDDFFTDGADLFGLAFASPR
jgi:hypothetical protein